MCSYKTHIINTEHGSIHVFFETQSKLYCLVHTVNNILQAHVYSSKDFLELECRLNNANIEKIKDIQTDQKVSERKDVTETTEVKSVEHKKKSPSFDFSYNLKKGFRYFGNFSINILYMLLNKHSMDLLWVNNVDVLEKMQKYQNYNTIFDDNYLNDKKLIAFVIIIVKFNFFNFYHQRHAYTIRKISGLWFQLDSAFSKPVLFPQNQNLNDHLIKILKNNKNDKSDNFVIQVFKKEQAHENLSKPNEEAIDACEK